MIGKMILQGLAAAALIAGAAAIYAGGAQALDANGASTGPRTDNGYLSPPERWPWTGREDEDAGDDDDRHRRRAAPRFERPPPAAVDTGYFVPARRHGDRDDD